MSLDRARPALRAFLVVGLLGALSPWLARAAAGAQWATLAWGFDLAAHWPWLWLPLVALGLAGLRRWPARAALAGLALASLGLALAPRLPEAEGEPDLRLVSANVHLGNRDAAGLIAWTQQQRADVLVLVELSRGYAQAVEQALGAQALPHRHWAPRDDPFGLGIAARWPLRDLRWTTNAAGIPQLRAVVDRPGAPFELMALHPMPPLSPRWHAQLTHDLHHLRAQGALPALLAGDLNASPWSLAVRELGAHGWRRATGLQPTWPSPVFGIAIDAVWAHGPWAVHSTQVGPDIGSDHRPVAVALRRVSEPAP